jgi:hypothetical protein
VPALHDVADDACAGGLRQRRQLAERVARIGGGTGENHPDKHRAFLPNRKFRSFEFRQRKFPCLNPEILESEFEDREKMPILDDLHYRNITV